MADVLSTNFNALFKGCAEGRYGGQDGEGGGGDDGRPAEASATLSSKNPDPKITDPDMMDPDSDTFRLYPKNRNLYPDSNTKRHESGSKRQ